MQRACRCRARAPCPSTRPGCRRGRGARPARRRRPSRSCGARGGHGAPTGAPTRAACRTRSRTRAAATVSPAPSQNGSEASEHRSSGVSATGVGQPAVRAAHARGIERDDVHRVPQAELLAHQAEAGPRLGEPVGRVEEQLGRVVAGLAVDVDAARELGRPVVVEPVVVGEPRAGLGDRRRARPSARGRARSAPAPRGRAPRRPRAARRAGRATRSTSAGSAT